MFSSIKIGYWVRDFIQLIDLIQINIYIQSIRSHQMILLEWKLEISSVLEKFSQKFRRQLLFTTVQIFVTD